MLALTEEYYRYLDKVVERYEWQPFVGKNGHSAVGPLRPSTIKPPSQEREEEKGTRQHQYKQVRRYGDHLAEQATQSGAIGRIPMFTIPLLHEQWHQTGNRDGHRLYSLPLPRERPVIRSAESTAC